jgi:hypothetical protein
VQDLVSHLESVRPDHLGEVIAKGCILPDVARRAGRP